ncbi:MAG TPA: hypothetical protein VGP33_16440 [Chloroflexota bacterium]|jgi:hypothetical protein|nr:hypothetical protein [Chloroflexota bacterium]
MDDELTLLLLLDVQARGQEALAGVAAGLEGIAAQGGLTLQALAPLGDAFSGLLDAAAGLGAALATDLAGIDWAGLGALLENVLLQPAALALGELGQVVQQALDGLGRQCLAAIQSAADAIAVTGPGQLAAATAAVLAAMDRVLRTFVPEAVTQGAQIVDGLRQGIDSLAGWMAAGVAVWLQTNVLQPVLTFFGISGSAAVMEGIGAELVQGLMDGMSGLAGALLLTTTDLITPLLPAIHAFQAAFTEAGGSLIDSVQGGILAKAGEIADAARAVVQGAIDAARSVLNGIEGSIAAAQSALAGMGAGAAVGHNALGTTDWRGGLTWVGEQGPELLNLPRGAQVIPLSGVGVAAGALPPSSGGRGNTINVTVSGNTVMSDQDADLLASRVGQAIVRQTGLAYSLVR